MRINQKDKICGFPVLKIRDLLKQNKSHNKETIVHFLSISKTQAKDVLKGLTLQGYLEIVKNDKYISHQNTIKGNSLAMGKAVASLSKDRANKLFGEFMNRVKEVNQNETYLYKIDRVLLFGSYLLDLEFVNDIDIAIEITKKEFADETWEIKDTAKVREAADKGVRFDTFISELFYSYNEVLKFLRAKSPYISIHTMEDGILKQTKTVQVYPIVGLNNSELIS